MNRQEVKAQRIRLGYTQGCVAEKLNMNVHTYRAKEAGRSPLKENEKLALAHILRLTPSQMNAFLFDNRLPIGSKLESSWNRPEARSGTDTSCCDEVTTSSQ